MAVKLICEDKDFRDETTWKMEMSDTSFSGSSTEIFGDSEGFTFRWEGEDENPLTDPIRSSTCTFSIIVRASDTALDAYLQAISQYTDQKLFCTVYQKIAAGAYAIKFRGMVQVSGMEFKDDANYEFMITVIDGIARLKDQAFEYAADPSTPDQITLLQTLIKVLEMTGMNDQYGGSDPFIASSLDFYDINMRTTYEMLNDVRVSKRTWLEDSENNTPMKAYDVLENLLKSCQAQIKMWEGRWNIFSMHHIAKSTNTFRLYSKSGSYLSSPSYNPDLSFPSGNARYPIYPISVTKEMLLKRSVVNWEAESLLKAFKDVPLPYNKDAIELTVMDPNVAKAPYRLTVNLLVRRQGRDYKGWNSATSTKDKPADYLYFEIRSGDYWLVVPSATFKVAGKPKVIPTGELSWVKNPIDKSLSVSFDYTKEYIRKINVVRTIPQLPAGSTGITVRLYAYQVSGSVSVAFAGTMQLEQQVNLPETVGLLNFLQGSEIKYKNMISVQVDNNTAGTLSEISTEDIFLNDGFFAPNKGCMEVYTGSEWVNSSAWRVGSAAASGIPYNQLWARENMRTFNVPRDRISGSVSMSYTYDVLRSFNWRSRKFFFNAGSFSTRTGIWEGDWIATAKGTEHGSVSATPPDYERIGRLDNKVNELAESLAMNNGTIQVVLDGLGGLQKTVGLIGQTRGLNADKYLLDMVPGLPLEVDNVGSERVMKAVLGEKGWRLEFVTS